MSTETLKESSKVSIKNIRMKKINVDVLKRKIFLKKQKESFHYKIILLTLIISFGVASYFVG